MTEPEKHLVRTFEETQAAQRRFVDENRASIVAAAEAIGKSIRTGGKLLLCGRGEAFVNAPRVAAELVSRLSTEARPVPALALTEMDLLASRLARGGEREDDTDPDTLFLKQVRVLGKAGDVVLAISTTGNSAAVLHAATEAKKLGCVLVTMTAGSGGKLRELGDIRINSTLTQDPDRIHEVHLFALHSLVDVLDRFFLK